MKVEVSSICFKFKSRFTGFHNIMVVCPGCGLIFDRLWKRGYCCGHCMDGRGHGKNCGGRDFVVTPKAMPAMPRHRSRSRSHGRGERRRLRAESPQPGSISAGPPAEATTPHCAICHIRPCTHACIPCGHRILCVECSTTECMLRMNWRCPQCRVAVREVLRIYI